MATYEENWNKVEKRYHDMYIFTRKSDGKQFRTTFHSHVSTIQAEDGEEDSVKWAWEDVEGVKFVSMTEGHGYIRTNDPNFKD